MSNKLISIASAIRKRFYDNFAGRSNTTGSLGIATDGSQWDTINGTIQVTTAAATATTTPTSGAAGTAYPMAIQNMPTNNNIIKLGGTNEGSAVALWVQSSSDWWMVNVEGTQVTNTNYAGATYWSYNYQYQYTSAQTNNYAWTPYMTTQYTSNTNTTWTAGATSYTAAATINYTAGATTWYVATASSTPYTASTPTTSSTPYTSGTPYSSSTPYTAATKYTSATFKVYGTIYANNYTAGATTYTAGATTYTKGATVYTKGTTTYTAGVTTYTAGTTTYYLVPPGTYQSSTPYTSDQAYTSSVPYTTATTTGAPYTTLTGYGQYTSTIGTYYFATTSGFVYITAANYYTYAAGSTTTYSEYLKIKQSVSSTVSEITSSLISATQSIKSLLVSITGNQITARAYSDTNFVTQIGSDLVYTATGATVTSKYGIAVSPSSYNQSAIIGTSLEINRN